MTDGYLTDPVPFAAAAGLVALVTAFAAGTLVFGDPADEAAFRAATITVGVTIGAFLVRRVDAS